MKDSKAVFLFNEKLRDNARNQAQNTQIRKAVKREKPRKRIVFKACYGGGCGIRTLVGGCSNGFQEVYQRIPFQLSSVQFVLKRFPKILILQGFLGLFGTDMN